MPAKPRVLDYATYCILYATTILSNKYVLSSLGFQYPTIFQTWQTFVSVVLIHIFTGNVLKHVALSDIIPWIPAMMLYVGSIFSGSKALSHFPIQTFVLSHGASDVILLMCDGYLPSGAVHLSMPLKMSGMMFALWSAHYDVATSDSAWIMLHTVFAGAYRTAAFWYTSPQWPYSGLSIVQRQYLNNLLGLITLFPLAIFLGHHQQVQRHFLYLGELKFYVGCMCSGILGWAVYFTWGRFGTKINSANIHMIQLMSKVMTLLLAMQLFPVTHTLLLWVAILLGISGDIAHILGSMVEESVDYGHDMSDVLVGS